VIAHWLCHRWQNPLKYDDIDWASVITAANHCDEPVPLRYGGFEPRYCCDGIISADETHFSVAGKLLTSCAGTLYFRRGQVSMEVGVSKTPVMTLTDRDILGEIKMRHGAPLEKAVNRIRTSFVTPNRSYAVQNGPIYDRPDFQASDGRINEKTLEFPFTSSAPMVQRLAKRYCMSQRMPRQGSILAGPIAQLLDAGDVITIDSALSYLSGVYEVHEITHREDGVALTIAEYGPEIDDWAPMRDEQSWWINPVNMK
jgi:hypothetical protein